MFWVSCWLRVFRKKGPKPRRRKETWQADFDRVTEQLRNDPEATIIRPRVGRLISSFVLIFPALWGFLVALHAAGILRNELVVQCDHTFVIEWQGYAWGMLGFVFHRRIAGYWRRSFVPLMMNCRPVETAASYLVMFQILKDECKKRGLPLATQLACDHFGGIPKAFLTMFPDATVVTSMWHMLRNIKANQSKKPRRGERSPPKLTGRPINVITSYIAGVAVLPTRLMFHVFWKIRLRRMVRVWGDRTWYDYFTKQYLETPKAFPGADGPLLWARWHYGLWADVLRGHPPSHQPGEQANSNLRRQVGSHSPGSLDDTALEMRTAARVWDGEPEDVEASFSLKASMERSGQWPTVPDKWMEDGKVWKLPLAGNVRIPSHKRIMDAYLRTQASQEARTVRSWTNERRGVTIYCMRLGAPGTVSCEVFQSMRSQLQCKTEADLIRVWTEADIVVDTDLAAAPLSVNWSALKAHWACHCLVMCQKAYVGCTCGLFLRRGHCPHAYWAEEMQEGGRKVTGAKLPPPSAGQAALDQGVDSDVEMVRTAATENFKSPPLPPASFTNDSEDEGQHKTSRVVSDL